jgi:hypothetical protein
MKKLIMLVAALALVVPAFCAVENVKVGGDLTFIGVERNNFDFVDDDVLKMNQHYIFSAARVYVSADLSNKVSTMVRFISERDFGNDYLKEVRGSAQVDLAYVKIADLMTPGLTLTVGRQELKVGEGMVVGSRYRAADYLLVDMLDTMGVDLGLQKAFDAIKLEYAFQGAPVTLSGFKAKIIETYGASIALGPISLGDVDLLGIVLNWKPASFTLEPYWIDVVSYGSGISLNTAGLRATWNPDAMKGLALKGEWAQQFGDATAAATFKGYGGYLGAGYTFGNSMKPTICAQYSYFSKAGATDIKNWVPVFPSDVASRVGKIAYPALFPAGEGIALNAFGSASGTGLSALKVGFGINPTEKLGLSLDWFNLNALDGAGARKALGNELDLGLNYAYTEDVALGLDLGMLFTGDNIKDNVAPAGTANAWQLLGSLKVGF